jgi:hypothetical protein
MILPTNVECKIVETHMGKIGHDPLSYDFDFLQGYFF